MAHVYIYSGAAGAGTGADWANAYTTAVAATAAKAAGDNFWVAHDHAETQATAMTITSPGTAAAPCTMICVDRSGTVPPVAADLRTTATITTTGNSALLCVGFMWCYGIKFSMGSGAVTNHMDFGSAASNHSWVLDSCALIIGATNGGSNITLGVTGNTACKVRWSNTTVKFAAVGQTIIVQGCEFVWEKTAAAIDVAGSIPTSLFAGSTRTGNVIVRGVDLSALSTGKNLVGAVPTASKIAFVDCKLDASVTVALAPASHGSGETTLVRCDSGATNYRHEKYMFAGVQTVETTLLRGSGASDGTTSISWKIVTTADAKWIVPFECVPMAIWNDTTGANRTVTVYGYWNNAALPKNDDIWIEVSYLGSSATPIATIDSSNTKATFLTANADQGSDSPPSGSWSSDATTPFSMSVTLSSPQPAMKGPIYVTVKVAKASATFYVDPKPVLS